MRFWRKNKDREIFRFWDGKAHRGIDPIKALRALHTHDTFNIATDPLMAEKGDQESIAKTLQAIRDAFGVTEYSEQNGKSSGLTEGEQFELFWQFFEFVDALKKNTGPKPTLPERTESGFSEVSITSVESDCTPTASESKSEEQPAC